MDYLEHLKKQDKNGEFRINGVWTIKNIQAGFEKFYDENGYYPSATEINKYDYLPNSKQIQRRFGGISNLRKEMNLRFSVKDHNKGRARSKMAGLAMKRSYEYEESYYEFLTSKIPELYIHEQKVVREGGHRVSCDFFIYLPNSKKGIVIDIFYAQDIDNLLKQVRIKEPKYAPLQFKTYLVCMNEEISSEEIKQRLNNRKIPLPSHIYVNEVGDFNKTVISNIEKLYKR